jgi:hypothetical protein
MLRVLRNISFLVLAVVCLSAAPSGVYADEGCGWGDENFYDGYNFTGGSSLSECQTYCHSVPNDGGGVCYDPDVQFHEGIDPNCGWCQCYDCVPYI